MKQLFWLWIALALAAVLAVELLLPPSAPEVSPRPQRTELLEAAEIPLESLELPVLERYASVTERPLFIEDRRPQDDDEEEAPAQPTPPPNRAPPRVNLTGIVQVGEVMYALVLRPGNKDGMLKLRQGEQVEGWTVQQIRPDGIELAQGSGRHQLPLRAYKPVLPPPPQAQQAKPGAQQQKPAAGRVPPNAQRQRPSVRAANQRPPVRPPNR